MLCLLAAAPALRVAPSAAQLRVPSRASQILAAEGAAIADDVTVGTSADFAAGVVVPARPAAATMVAKESSVDATALSGNAMEDLWDKSRGRPLRRSMALWWFATIATWKICRAGRKEEKQVKCAQWLRDELLRLGPTIDDAVVAGLVRAATNICEAFVGQWLIERAAEEVLPIEHQPEADSDDDEEAMAEA